MRFTEMNQFGLPRAVDEIEIGFGHLKFHIYPHQVHILTEIANAVTVPPKPAAKLAQICQSGQRCQSPAEVLPDPAEILLRLSQNQSKPFDDPPAF